MPISQGSGTFNLFETEMAKSQLQKCCESGASCKIDANPEPAAKVMHSGASCKSDANPEPAAKVMRIRSQLQK